MKNAVVVLASGIGNCVRWMPVVRILYLQGYRVEILLENVEGASHWIQLAELLNVYPDVYAAGMGLLADRYDVAVFSHWSKAGDQIDAAWKLRAPADLWHREGDPGAVRWIANALGWLAEIPAPAVVTAPSTIRLARGTVAMHAGAKPGWPWKRWPYFSDLARHFRYVIGVGMPDDDPIDSPNVTDTRGRLSLVQLATVLRECSAVVSNDSGVSHIAAAVGVPTFPIYGITRAAREMQPLPNVHPIENRDACAPSCGKVTTRSPAGCELARAGDRGPVYCLNFLSAADVAKRIRTIVPDL